MGVGLLISSSENTYFETVQKVGLATLGPQFWSVYEGKIGSKMAFVWFSGPYHQLIMDFLDSFTGEVAA
jgi:hypothetical protein